MSRTISPSSSSALRPLLQARPCPGRRFLNTPAATTRATTIPWRPAQTTCRRFFRAPPSRPHNKNMGLQPQSQPGGAGGGGARRGFKTVQEAKSRYQNGPFSWKAGVLFVLTSAGLMWYWDNEKKRVQRRRIAEATKGVGRPKVGGPFELIDQNGKPFSSEDLKGKHFLLYFGFTHCPDICPEELDKMARMYDLVQAARPGAVVPVFITCDPARDDPATLKQYLAEFHPRFVGLTGTYEQIKAVCKAYRVYFSTPQSVKPGEDYLVDHSIYFYLMDPEGDFVEALGRQHSPDEGAKMILDYARDWKAQKANGYAVA